MNTLRQFMTTLLLLLFLLLLSQTGSVAAPPAQKSQPGLFTEVVGVSNLDTSNDPTVIRSRPVEVDLGQLAGSATQGVGIASTPEINDVVQLNLFDDVSYTAILDEIQALPNGGYVWIGHLEGIDLSEAIFVVNAGQTAGNIAEPDAFYGIRYVGGDVHAVLQIDQSAFPGDNPIPVDLPEDPAPIQVTADDGSQIDVLVAYTGAARQAAGGTTAMQNLVNLAVAETNQSYANSGINPRLRLAHTVEVDYTESGDLGTDLGRITNTSDGFMDTIHGLRNTHAADLVSLIIEGGNYCGIAYLMTNVSTSFESSGFSVTARNCATGYYSFGHELGHNMGARHDWYVDASGVTPYPYGHGYVYLPDRWRTVMAYNTQCSDSGFNCTRLPYWSNPNKLYNDSIPMGVSESSAQPSDNHKTLNNTAYTVANFRAAAPPPSTTGPLVYSSHSIDDNTVNQSNGDNDGLAECGETIETFIWLTNQGTNTASDINATLSTSSPYVNFVISSPADLNTNTSTYNNIPGGSTLPSTGDFDFSIAANTPNGYVIPFKLTITASNGGPWNTVFNVPVYCSNTTSGDSYELDNNSSQANPIADGLAQTHSIIPANDQDWVTFTLNSPAQVILETSGSSGDTRMWLFNSSLNQISFNDDISYPTNLFSRIERSCAVNSLPAGKYYVKVDEYGNNDQITEYNLTLTLSNCPDAYEPDNTSGQAKLITGGSPHQHSIVPVGDEDWATFTLNTPSEIVLTTSGYSGDTRMWLYNSSLNQINYNDDIAYPTNLFSRIKYCDGNTLPTGTYYVKVNEYWSNFEIGNYTLALATECTRIYLPLVIK